MHIPKLIVFWLFPGARNHSFFVLFLAALNIFCMWMFYGSMICRSPKRILIFWNRWCVWFTVHYICKKKRLKLCVLCRLVQTLSTALCGGGRVGGSNCSHGLLSLGALCLFICFLQYCLGLHPTCVAALPGKCYPPLHC